MEPAATAQARPGDGTLAATRAGVDRAATLRADAGWIHAGHFIAGLRAVKMDNRSAFPKRASAAGFTDPPHRRKFVQRKCVRRKNVQH